MGAWKQKWREERIQRTVAQSEEQTADLTPVREGIEDEGRSLEVGILLM